MNRETWRAQMSPVGCAYLFIGWPLASLLLDWLQVEGLPPA